MFLVTTFQDLFTECHCGAGDISNTVSLPQPPFTQAFQPQGEYSLLGGAPPSMKLQPLAEAASSKPEAALGLSEGPLADLGAL